MVLVYMVYRRGKALLLLACFVLPLEAECWWKWVGEGEHGVVPTNDDVGVMKKKKKKKNTNTNTNKEEGGEE